MARELKGEKLEKELLRLEEMKAYEKENAQYELICGIDEAGRGPLAGPVAAGAVILPKDCQILYLNDSKKLSEKADEVYSLLAKNFNIEYDETGSIGKRYRRQDEIGTPFCITVDFETENDGCVTIRHRDSMTQERVKIEELNDFIAKSLEF